MEPPPSNTIVVHRPIFCLGQTNRIEPPPGKCKKIGDYQRSTLPVGKGWIYTFKKSNRSGWVDLSVRLDKETERELLEIGLEPADANFQALKEDLDELERRGYLTILDKKYPRAVFRYQNERPVYIHCGQNKVTEKSLKGSAKLKAEGGVGFEAPLWTRLLSGLKARLGLSVDAEASGEMGTTWKISVDTKKLPIFTMLLP